MKSKLTIKHITIAIIAGLSELATQASSQRVLCTWTDTSTFEISKSGYFFAIRYQRFESACKSGIIRDLRIALDSITTVCPGVKPKVIDPSGPIKIMKDWVSFGTECTNNDIGNACPPAQISELATTIGTDANMQLVNEGLKCIMDILNEERTSERQAIMIFTILCIAVVIGLIAYGFAKDRWSKSQNVQTTGTEDQPSEARAITSNATAFRDANNTTTDNISLEIESKEDKSEAVEPEAESTIPEAESLKPELESPETTPSII